MRELIAKSLIPIRSASANASGAVAGDRGDFNLAPGWRAAGPLAPAAVLVPLVERASGITVLLTRRTDHLPDHAGQVSFPGGRAEPEDSGPVATALREAEEEIGLDPQLVDLVGLLDLYETVTGYLITPVVSFVSDRLTLRPDPDEVAEVFEIPLALALDRANYRRESVMYRGQRRGFYSLSHGDHYVWGATAGMLVNLCERFERINGSPGDPATEPTSC